MFGKKQKRGKMGLIVVAILIVIVTGAAIYGGQSGWFTGALVKVTAPKVTTPTTITSKDNAPNQISPIKDSLYPEVYTSPTITQLPDLVITKVASEPYEGKEDGKIWFTVGFKNIGDACVEDYEIILDGRFPFNTDQTETLIAALTSQNHYVVRPLLEICPNTYSEIKVTFDKPARNVLGGIMVLEAKIDPFKRIEEKNEGNNVYISNGYMKWIDVDVYSPIDSQIIE